MHIRPAATDDVAVIAELVARYDTAWFGAPEHSVAEVAELLGWAEPLAENSLVVHDADRLVGAALRQVRHRWASPFWPPARIECGVSELR